MEKIVKGATKIKVHDCNDTSREILIHWLSS